MYGREVRSLYANIRYWNPDLLAGCVRRSSGLRHETIMAKAVGLAERMAVLAAAATEIRFVPVDEAPAELDLTPFLGLPELG